jgi:hypothetical protein
VPQIVRAVTVPVIAAGGIADAGVVAALTSGAAAVQVGTAYLLCAEAATTRVHRQALASPQPFSPRAERRQWSRWAHISCAHACADSSRA